MHIPRLSGPREASFEGIDLFDKVNHGGIGLIGGHESNSLTLCGILHTVWQSWYIG